MIDATASRLDRPYTSEALRRFCDRLTETARSGLIVAIARKMPRLLEYLGVMSTAPCPVITERALPWLGQDQPDLLVFCDDILNVGTTLSHYVQYAQARIGSKIKIRVYGERGGKYVALHDKSPLTQYDIDIQETLEDDAYWEFETALPQEILTIGKPYDIDFPILELPLTKADTEQSDERWLELLSDNFGTVHNLTVPRQQESGVATFTIISPLVLSTPVFTAQTVQGFGPPPKARLYLSRREKVLRLVPMYIPSVTEAVLKDAGSSLPNTISPLFSEFSKRATPAEPFDLEPQYNLLLYLVSFEFGRRLLPHLQGCLHSGQVARPCVSPHDLRLIFGPTVAAQLFAALTKLLEIPAGKEPLSRTASPISPPESPIKRQLAEAVRQELVQRGYEGEKPPQVFRQALRVLDEKFAQGNNPSVETIFPAYRRLRNGLPLYDLWWIVCSMSNGRNTPFEEMSFLLDYYIDVGAVVPVVERVQDVYFRTYRRGEADPIEFAQLVNALLKKHEENYPDRPLMKTAFTKILSAMAIYYGHLLPLRPVFEYRGMVPRVVLDDEIETSTEDALEFLHRKGAITFEDPREQGPANGQLF